MDNTKSPLLRKAEEGIGIMGETGNPPNDKEVCERLPVEKITTLMEMVLQGLERKTIQLENGELNQLIKLAERILNFASSRHDDTQTPHIETQA